jgi:hypothetical protein
MIVLPEHLFETSYRTSQKPILHRVYLQKYNDPEVEIHTTSTMISILNILHRFFLLKWLREKVIVENSKMTCIEEEKP